MACSSAWAPGITRTGMVRATTAGDGAIDLDGAIGQDTGITVRRFMGTLAAAITAPSAASMAELDSMMAGFTAVEVFTAATGK